MALIGLVFHFVTLCLGAQAEFDGRRLSPMIDYLRAPTESAFERNQRSYTAYRSIEDTSPEEYLPTDIPDHASGRHVASRIVQHSAQSILESKSFRRSGLGQRAAAVDKKMSTNIQTLPGSKPLEFRVKAAQTMASVRYAGFGQTVVSYRLYDQAVLVEMSGQIMRGVRIVADHLDSPEEKAGKLSLRWTW